MSHIVPFILHGNFFLSETKNTQYSIPCIVRRFVYESIPIFIRIYPLGSLLVYSRQHTIGTMILSSSNQFCGTLQSRSTSWIGDRDVLRCSSTRVKRSRVDVGEDWKSCKCMDSRLGKGKCSTNELAGVCSASVFVSIAVQNNGRMESVREMCFTP